MTLLLIIVALFVSCGVIVTAAISRMMGVALSLPKILSGFFLSALAAGIVASAALTALVRFGCGEKKPCEYGGFMEGGIVLVGLWLVIYSIVYLAAALLVARHQAQRVNPSTGDSINEQLGPARSDAA